MRKYYLLFYFVFSINILYSQIVYITKQQACEDVDLYFARIQECHPNMYWHTPKPVVDDFIKTIKKAFRDSIGIGEFTLRLSHANHFFDSHTDIDRQYTKVKTDKIFPEIEYKNKEIYLRGTHLRVDSINSISAKHILDWVMELFGSDFSVPYIEYLFSVSSEFQWGVNDFNISPPYKVKITNKNGLDSLIFLEGIDKSLIANKNKKYFYHDKPYKFEVYPNEKIAIIRYHDIFWKEDYPEVDTLLYRFFQDCQKNDVRFLFFDVSKNTGGYSRQFSFFFPYFQMNKNPSYQLEIGVRQSHQFVTYVDSLSFRNYPKKIKGIAPFPGKVFIYQSHVSQSGTPDFCAIMKIFTNAVLVGTETGSGVPLYVSGEEFNLPHSKLAHSISRRLWISESPKLPRNSSGYLLPDIEYPFHPESNLEIDDCLKIVELDKQRR